METNAIIVAVLATLAAGGVFYAVVYPYLSGDIKAEKRQAALKSASKKAGPDRAADGANRRKQVADSLKEVENRGKSKKKTLEQKIAQAGLDWTRQKYLVVCVISGVAFGLFVYWLKGDELIALGAMVTGGFGIPNWWLGFMCKRRIKKFAAEFPNAVDVIIRGIKAGLPLGDCLRIIATEAVEPVRSEFRNIVEAQQMGLSIGEAVERIVERVPTAEASFFSIVINIQQKAGGNLSEALGNLSRVLRERKKMRQKVQAMSSEAKASAGIIGALPFIVAGMVYLTTPAYMSLLWTTSTGQMVMGVAGCWMGIGIMSMKKMINFDM